MNTAMQKPRVLFSSPYHQQSSSPAKQDAALEQSSSNNEEDAQDNSGSAGEGGNEKIDGIMLSLDDDEKMELFDTLTQYFSKDNQSNKDDVDISDMTSQEET